MALFNLSLKSDVVWNKSLAKLGGRYREGVNDTFKTSRARRKQTIILKEEQMSTTRPGVL